MTAPRDSRAAALPSRQGRRRFLVRLTALGAVLAIAVVVGLWVWGSADWYGRPEALLPADTAIVATFRDFSGFLRRVEALQAVRALLADEEARAALSVAGLEDAGGNVRLVSGADRLFLDRYLGRELTVGVVPPAEAGEQSTVLVVARTRMGFEEKMAEMVARHSPKAPLEREKYRGQTIYRYRDSEALRSFVCCRFGRTVVASVGSEDPGAVRGMIDRKKGEGRSLIDVAEYGESAAWRAGEGQMAAFMRPDGVSDALLGLPEMGEPDKETRFWLDYFESCARGVRWAALRSELSEGFHVNMEWRGAVSGRGAMLDDGYLDSQLSRLPRKSPLFLSVRSAGLRAFLTDLHRRLRESKAFRRDVRSFEKGWKALLGSSYRSDWLEPMGKGFGLAVTGLGGGLMPIPSVHFWWDFASSGSARSAAKAVPMPRIGYRFTRVGNLLDGSVQSGGREVAVDWNRLAREESLPFEESLLSHPLLRGEGDSRGLRLSPVVVLLVDLRSSYREIRGLESAAQLWSAGDREAYETSRRVFAVARHFQALRLTAAPTSEGGKAALYVSVR